MSPSSHAAGTERGENVGGSPAIFVRRLPLHTTLDSLNRMFMFADGFVGAHFVKTDLQQNQGYASAIARFWTYPAADKAKNLLDGKKNNPNEPALQMEVSWYSHGGGLGNEGNDPEMMPNRVNSSSSTASSNEQSRQPSRYNGTFQNLERISPPTGVSGFSNGGSLFPTDGASLSNVYSPQLPVSQAMGDRRRRVGRDVIRENGTNDEPGDLLNDPMGFARNGNLGQLSRQPTNPQLPVSQLSNLSLNTNSTTSPISGYTSPGGNMSLQSPTSAMSPSSMGPNTPYQMATQYHSRSHYPPVNPADQNPPCNTLYVGNLPLNASEDELKAVFSKQRGYKRLCFRTKTAGPMCFVEFETITFATKTLHELYGHCLTNSGKSGIRLSFSKNPLGVRNGQPGGMGPPTPFSPSGPMSGMNGLGITPFSTANGPPPGLTAPPGLNSPLPDMNPTFSSLNNGGHLGMDRSMGLRSDAISPYWCPRTNGMFGPPSFQSSNLEPVDPQFYNYILERSSHSGCNERNGRNGQSDQSSHNGQNIRSSQSGQNGPNGQNNQDKQNLRNGRTNQNGLGGQNNQNDPNQEGQNDYNGPNGHYYDDNYRR